MEDQSTAWTICCPQFMDAESKGELLPRGRLETEYLADNGTLLFDPWRDLIVGVA